MFIAALPIAVLALGTACALKKLKDYRQLKNTWDKEAAESLAKSKELNRRIHAMDENISACNAECDVTDELFEEALDALAEHLGKPRRKARKLRVVK
jgi:benzoyl-CoA reductase/2-hydroxyglutaryl-CoA dehydratase subunit BcrC/BadD/HgdB